MSAHVRRIEAVEKDLKALSNASASRDDISRVRTEVKRLYDGLHLGEPVFWLTHDLKVMSAEFLDLRAHVSGIRTFELTTVDAG